VSTPRERAESTGKLSGKSPRERESMSEFIDISTQLNASHPSGHLLRYPQRYPQDQHPPVSSTHGSLGSDPRSSEVPFHPQQPYNNGINDRRQMEATPATAFQHNSWSGQPPPQQLPGFNYGQPAFSNYSDQTMSPTPFSLFSPSGPLPPQFTVGDGPHQAAASRDSRPYPLEDLDPLSPVNGSSLQQAAPTDGASLSDLESRLRALVTSLVDGSTSPGDARCIFDNLNQQIEVARRSSVNISYQQQQLNQSYPANGYAINTGYNTSQHKPTPSRVDIEKIKINQIQIGDADECRNSLLEFNSIPRSARSLENFQQQEESSSITSRRRSLTPVSKTIQKQRKNSSNSTGMTSSAEVPPGPSSMSYGPSLPVCTKGDRQTFSIGLTTSGKTCPNPSWSNTT
jgi:hypothetical protein